MSEIANALNIPEERLEEIVRFLAQASMIHHDTKNRSVKIKQNWKTLLIIGEELKINGSDKTAIGTIIIPPEKTIIIQDTSITNLTEKSLELELRIDTKLREIAINMVK